MTERNIPARIVTIYDATPGCQKDSEIKEALDIVKDAKKIQDILEAEGFAIETLGLNFPILEKIQALVRLKPDLIFNLCEGLGDNSYSEVQVASVLELLGLPFTGSGSLSLALCHDKALTKSVLNAHGVPNPKHGVIEPGEKISMNGLEFPLIVKPIHEDGSFGIEEDSIVSNLQNLKAKALNIHTTFQQAAIVEEYIDGREFNVSILGNDPFDFVQIREIQYLSSSRAKILSFEAKWKKSSPSYQGTLSTSSHDLPKSIEKKILCYALECFRILKMRDYARIDFRLGENQVPYVIDVNPNPCISEGSGMVMAAEQNKINHADLIRKITGLAFARARDLQNTGSRSF